LKQQPARRESTGSALSRGMNQASYGLSVAFAFVAAVMLLFLAGRWVDGALGIEPWGQVVGAVAGWVVGFLVVYAASQKGLR